MESQQLTEHYQCNRLCNQGSNKQNIILLSVFVCQNIIPKCRPVLLLKDFVAMMYIEESV